MKDNSGNVILKNYSFEKYDYSKDGNNIIDILYDIIHNEVSNNDNISSIRLIMTDNMENIHSIINLQNNALQGRSEFNKSIKKINFQNLNGI